MPRYFFVRMDKSRRRYFVYQRGFLVFMAEKEPSADVLLVYGTAAKKKESLTIIFVRLLNACHSFPTLALPRSG